MSEERPTNGKLSKLLFGVFVVLFSSALTWAISVETRLPTEIPPQLFKEQVQRMEGRIDRIEDFLFRHSAGEPR